MNFGRTSLWDDFRAFYDWVKWGAWINEIIWWANHTQHDTKVRRVVNSWKPNHMLNNHLSYLHNNQLPQESMKFIFKIFHNCSSMNLHIARNLRYNGTAFVIHMSSWWCLPAFIIITTEWGDGYSRGAWWEKIKMQPKVKIYCCRIFQVQRAESL